jgi:protein-L-isoaspartate(D-aspartate) O-methyltransferase
MFETEREELTAKLKSKGIRDENVLRAIREIPRHEYIPEAIRSHAYRDVALPIGYNQTISQPYTVAYMTQLLDIIPGDKILEIGTGSGYQAAILAHMGAKVYSIERQFEIYSSTRKLFDKLGIRVHTKYGDGTIGWEEYAPFNGIMVTAGAPSVPEPLKKQLEIYGRLVIPVGDKVSQKLSVITKTGDKKFSTRDIPEFSFVPLIGREGWNEK